MKNFRSSSVPRSSFHSTLFEPSFSTRKQDARASSRINSTTKELGNVRVTSRKGLVALLSTIVALHFSTSVSHSSATSSFNSKPKSDIEVKEMKRLLSLQISRPFCNSRRSSSSRSFSLIQSASILNSTSNHSFSSSTSNTNYLNLSSRRSFSTSSQSSLKSTSRTGSASSSSFSSTSINFITSRLTSLSISSPSKVLDWWNNRIISKGKGLDGNDAATKGKERQLDPHSVKSSTSSFNLSSSDTSLDANSSSKDHKHSETSLNHSVTGSSQSTPTSTSNQASTSNPSTSSSSSNHHSAPSSSSSKSNSSSSSSNSSSPPPPPHKGGKGTGRIHELMRHPALYSPVRAPRYPIVLCHGLYGFDVRGPFFGLEIHYWAATLDILRKKVGAEVIVRGVPGTGSIQSRAESLHEYLCSPEAGVRGKRLNFAAHSMGGLDVRHLLSHIQPLPSEYIPMSLTTISTPHRGSPFMDWCNANVGVGNDLVEEAIREEREGRNGAVLGERARKFVQDRKKEREILVKNKSGSGEKVDPIYSGVNLKIEEKVVEEKEEKILRPPYTLKTPLFVRPKNGKKSIEVVGNEKGESKSFSQDAIDSASKISKAGNDAIQKSSKDSDRDSRNSSSSETTKPENDSDSYSKAKDLATSTKEKETKSEKSKSSSLPFGFSTIASALSSLTGNFSSYMLSLLDQPAYAMLSTRYMSKVFNPRTPDVPSVKYYSIAARTRKLAIYHPLWLPKLVLDAAAESSSIGGESDGSAEALGSEMQGNDGLVNVQSAKWGEFLGVMEGCDHWDLRGSGGPRWKNDKLDPKTGRVREEHEEKERLKSERKDKKDLEKLEKEKKKEESRKLKEEERERERHNGDGGKSWIDINKLLGSWLSKSGEKKSQVTETESKESLKKASTATSDSTDVASIAQNFLENYASLTSSDEGSPDLSRSSSTPNDKSKSTSNPSSNQNSTSSSTSSNPDSSNSLIPSSLVPTSLTATPIPDSKLIKEVASWISDRLPERDQERRDLAERRAEIQDRDGYGLRKGGVEGLGWREGYNNDDTSPFNETNDDSTSSRFSLAGDAVGEWQGSDVAGISIDETPSSQQQADELKSSQESNLGLTLGSLPTLEELDPPPGSISSPSPTTLSSLSGTDTIPTDSDKAKESMEPGERDLEEKKVVSNSTVAEASDSSRREMKLRRDVEWLEALGEGAQARELRRELQWHRAQHMESKSKANQVQSSSSSSSSIRGLDSTSASNSDEPLILDVPDTPIKHPNLRKPSDRDDVYNWDVPNKRRRDLLSAMGVIGGGDSSFEDSNLLTSTQSLANGASVNSRQVSDRLGLGSGGGGEIGSWNSSGGGGGGQGREGYDGRMRGNGGRKESEKQRRERELKEEEVELERFWLAICRHLWLEGM